MAESNIGSWAVMERSRLETVPVALQMLREQPILCKERELLVVILQQAIRDIIHARGPGESAVALKAWEHARKALMMHIQEHGC